MSKTFFAAATLALISLAPVSASAQEGVPSPEAVEEVVETVEEVVEAVEEQDNAPKRPRYYQPVNFNAEEDKENILLLDLSTGRRVAIRLMADWAPNHVERVKTLTRQGFYDGVIFHRVIDGFMAQTGDPTGTGQGGSSLPDLKEEFNPMPHLRGTLSMARADSEDSANSQFFIVFYPRLGLDKKYTNFGRVIGGMDVVDSIQRGEPPTNPTRILQASLASDNRAAPVPQPVALPSENVTVDDLNAPIGQ